jgi:thioredoxin 1
MVGEFPGGRSTDVLEGGATNMAGEHVQEFTDGNFDQEVLGSDVPVVVDFWAEWCMPCKILSPTIDQVAEEFSGKVKVGKLDIDSNQSVAVKFGISAIPTVLLFKDGQVVKKFVGLTSKEELAATMSEAAGGGN